MGDQEKEKTSDGGNNSSSSDSSNSHDAETENLPSIPDGHPIILVSEGKKLPLDINSEKSPRNNFER